MILGNNGYLFLMGLTISLASSVAEGKKGLNVGDRAPVFSLKAANADTIGRAYVGLEHFYAKGKEPKNGLLLSFFATYCEPCKKEMPFLSALYEAYKDSGLQILLVSIDKDKEKIAETVALAEKARVSFPVLTDRFNIVARRYSIEKLPSVYLLDSKGTVVLAEVGYSGDVTTKLHEAVLTQLSLSSSGAIPKSLEPFLKETTAVKPAAAMLKESDRQREGKKPRRQE